MKRFLFALAVVTAMAGPAQAQVHIDIGIKLPAPPSFVVIPGTPVYYAPHAAANVFLYAHQYWAFNGNGWYVGGNWNGPWTVVAPAVVPAPILRVPVGYYPAPPPPWKGWRADRPPQWETHYGGEWHEDAQERSWREREERWGHGEAKGCPPGLAKQGRC